MCPQVDAADAQVVAGADEAWLELQGLGVGLHCLLAAVPVSQRGPQAVPQQVVLQKVTTAAEEEKSPDRLRQRVVVIGTGSQAGRKTWIKRLVFSLLKAWEWSESF